jgi:hypothetical protein
VLLAVGTSVWVLGLLVRSSCATAAWDRGRGAGPGLCAEEWGWSGLAGPERALTGDLPPLPALLGHLVEAVARLRPDAQDRVVVAAAVTAAVLAVGLCVAVVALTLVRPRRPWDAAVLAFAPLLVLTWFTSWHTLAAVALGIALWAWAGGRTALAGVAVGAAASTVLASGLLLAGFALGARGGRTPAGAVGRAVMAAALTWMLLGVPRFVGGAEVGWWVRGIDLGSPWLLVSQLTDVELSTSTLTATALALWACWALVVALLVRRAASREPVVEAARLALLLLGGALVVSPSLPATAGLVLLPLAAVAVPRWGPLLLWQACELLYVVVLGLHLMGALAPGSGGDPPLLWLAVALRVVGTGVLLWAAATRGAPADSGDDHPVEGGGGVADSHVDLLADGRHPRA